MADQPKSDVRTAIEWAWAEYSNCVIRDSKGIVQKLDMSLASTPMPQGGDQFLDLAVSNKVSFQKEFVLRVLGADVADEDEIALKEKKSIEDIQRLLAQFRDMGKLPA